MLQYSPPSSGAPPVEVQRFGPSHAMFRMELHGHQFYELLYLSRGKGTHRVGGEARKARDGDLFLLAPGDVHDATGLRGSEGVLLLFKGEALAVDRSDSAFVSMPDELVLLPFAPTTEPAASRHLHVSPKDRPRWNAHLSALERELQQPTLGSTEAARAWLTLILIDAARLAAPSVSRFQPAARPLLAQVFQFIEARYRQPISLADVSQSVGKSPAYLTDFVKRQTGRSVLAWIIERRMAEARRLLVETTKDVAEIAEAVSYLDPGYFIRQFRKAHGVTPLQYRQSHH